jgi:hypothetical protein
VINSFPNDDVKGEMKIKYKEILLIEEIIGAINDRNRHLQIELFDRKKNIYQC